jgi:hypothetical protein
MSDITATTTDATAVRDSRCRESHPERIDIGTDTLVRDDSFARNLGRTTRSLTGDDKHGAPYVRLGCVKYRPQKAYYAWLAGRIRQAI